MFVGVPMYFPLEAKNDPCSRMKITKNGQDQLLHHRIDQCSDWSKYYVWAVEMHVYVVVLNSSQWGDPGEPTGWILSGNWVTKDILKVLKVGKWFKIKSKDEGWFKSRNWALGCRVWVFWKSMVLDSSMNRALWVHKLPTTFWRRAMS